MAKTTNKKDRYLLSFSYNGLIKAEAFKKIIDLQFSDINCNEKMMIYFVLKRDRYYKNVENLRSKNKNGKNTLGI